MKKVFFWLIILAVSNYSAIAQSSDFSATINNWARYSDLNVEKIFSKEGVALLSKDIDGHKLIMSLIIYDEVVEIKVPAFSVTDLVDFLDDDFLSFVLGLFELNAHNNFGGWGLEVIADEQNFTLFYGIPIDGLTKENFKFISSYMISYVYDAQLVVVNHSKKGMGFAEQNDVNSMIEELKEIGKKQNKILRENLKKK